MSKYFKSLKFSHVPLDPEDPKALNEEFKDFLDEISETEAEMIQRLREEKGWTLAVLAKKLDISEETLQKIESQNAAIPFDVATKLGDIFNVDPKFFLR